MSLTWSDVSIGQRIDFKDCFGSWCVARVADKIEKGSQKMMIHFEGWTKSYDEWVDVLDFEKRSRPYANQSSIGPRGLESDEYWDEIATKMRCGLIKNRKKPE